MCTFALPKYQLSLKKEMLSPWGNDKFQKMFSRFRGFGATSGIMQSRGKRQGKQWDAGKNDLGNRKLICLHVKDQPWTKFEVPPSIRRKSYARYSARSWIQIEPKK